MSRLKTPELVHAVREEFKNANRKASLGIRTHLVVRDKEEDAWKAANELIVYADPAVKAQRRQRCWDCDGRSGGFKPKKVPITLLPRIFGTVCPRSESIVARLSWGPRSSDRYTPGLLKIGRGEFILSGFPHVEECQRVASDVIPC
ncbi:MAG: hypothetical protein CM1200mP22_05210 [Dehalococcoidia bacterium]|nr:MAG: hypothetical protein CM1200mP22_05210 [Dehalococcoidia bacterium]